jgi:hypothetical protein
MPRTRAGWILAALVCLVLLPASALAQSTIAGVVKDTSDSVLPGVQVDAESPVLIEGVKSTTTDGDGLFKIVDLRPGTYTVTFTLQGFTTIKRTEIVVPAESTVTVNAELKLGTLTEAITVTTAAPFVDTQSAARVQSLDKDAIDNIPTSRTIQTMGQLIPGVTISTGTADVGGSNAAMQSYMTVRGIPAAQNTVMVDGMIVNGVEANGAIQAYFNDAASDQLVYQTSDTTAANSGGGVQVNMIPREGGNRFSGDSQAVYRPGEGGWSPLRGFQANNLTQRLKDMKLPNQPGQVYISDLTVSQGGPILRNKIWFFGSVRDNRVNNYVLDTKFDDGSPGHNPEYIKDTLGRGTVQVTPRIKVTGYYDRVWKYRGYAMTALTDPETASVKWTSPNYSTGSIKGTWTATSHLFIEGGYSLNVELRDVTTNGQFVNRQMDDPTLIGTPKFQTNDWYRFVGEASDQGGRMVAATSSRSQTWPRQGTWQGSASYVTGAHTVKAGFQWQTGEFYHSAESHGDITTETYRFGVQDSQTGNWTFSGPRQATIVNTPRQTQERMNRIAGFYVQDQWRFKRLTVNGGLRYELVNSQVDETTSPAGRWVPARTQPEVKDRPDWTDWAPRSSFVYDLFGNGRTAIKYSINRYNTAETTGVASDYSILGSATSTRQWTDVNNDGIVQGQRLWSEDGTYYYDPRQPGLKNVDCVYQTPGCELYLSGPAGVDPITGLPQTLTPLAANFGLPGSLPEYLGFPRQWRLEQGFEVQHQVLPRVGVTFAYVHWERFNNTNSVNKFRQMSHYTTYQFFNPISGEPLPYLYYNLTSAGSTAQNANNATVTTVEPKHKLRYNSYQLDFRARPYRGAQIFGGITFQRSRSVTCETSTGFLDDPNDLRFCDDNDLLGAFDGDARLGDPFIRDFKLATSIPLWYGITFSAAYQNLDQGAFDRSFTYGRSDRRYPDGSLNFVDSRGVPVPATPCPARQAVCAVPGALSAPSTLTSSTSGALPIDIPGQNRDERLSQLDVKVSKTFRVGRMSILPTVEAFNLFNADTILGRSSFAYPSQSTGVSTYLRPNNVLKPRLIGVGMIVKW